MHFIIFDWAFKCFAGWMGGCRPDSKTSNQRWKYRCCKAWIKFHFEHMWSCEWRLQGIISCHFLSQSFEFHASLACVLHFSSTEWWLECYPILVFNSHQAHVELWWRLQAIMAMHIHSHPSVFSAASFYHLYFNLRSLKWVSCIFVYRWWLEIHPLHFLFKLLSSSVGNMYRNHIRELLQELMLI